MQLDPLYSTCKEFLLYIRLEALDTPNAILVLSECTGNVLSFRQYSHSTWEGRKEEKGLRLMCISLV